MCGIIGVVSKKDVVSTIVDGLKRLEYRGYDSAGIATYSPVGIDRIRAVGKIRNLESAVSQSFIKGTIGIGHTRWATHGVANETNAHPHMTDTVAVVHNGIIENYSELIQQFSIKLTDLQSDTDTEVVAHILTHYICLLYTSPSPRDS